MHIIYNKKLHLGLFLTVSYSRAICTSDMLENHLSIKIEISNTIYGMWWLWACMCVCVCTHTSNVLYVCVCAVYVVCNQLCASISFNY